MTYPTRRLVVLIVAVISVNVTALFAATQRTEPAPAPTTTVAPTTTAAPTTTVAPTTTSTTTTTTTTVVPAATAATLRCPSWAAINLAAGFPVEELATADRILYAESRCRLDAVNPSDTNGGSWCAYQINRIHEGHLLAAGVIDYWEQLVEDMTACAAAAFVVYTRSNGWTPWATY